MALTKAQAKILADMAAGWQIERDRSPPYRWLAGHPQGYRCRVSTATIDALIKAGVVQQDAIAGQRWVSHRLVPTPPTTPAAAEARSE
jgi:hypothetical protein